MVDKKDWLEKTGRLRGPNLYFSGGYVDFGVCEITPEISEKSSLVFFIYFLFQFELASAAEDQSLEFWGKTLGWFLLWVIIFTVQ